MEELALVKKHKNKIINVAVIMVTLLIASGVYRAQIKSMESLKARKDIELKKNEAFLDIARSQEKFSLYKKALAKKDISAVINTITNIAKDSNVRIISVKPAGEGNFPFYVKYPFNLIIGVDSYHDLGKFISKIESYPDGLFFVDKAQIILKDRVKELKEPEEKSKLIINLIISTAVFKNQA